MHTLERVWIPDATHEFFRLGHTRCISYFSYGCDKIYLLKSDLRKRVYFGSLSESTAHCSGKSRQKEGERAGPIASTGRKQREVNTHAQLTIVFVFSPGPQSMEWVQSQ